MSTVQSTVQYRNIPDYPGYRVGDDGSIWGAWTKRHLGGRRGTSSFIGTDWVKLQGDTEKKTGYKCVKLRKNGKQHHLRVHVLVLRAFVGPRPKGKMCCHGDDNPNNNTLSNLRWDTQKGNSADLARNGKTLKGESAWNARFTAEDVTEIRRRFANGEMPETIGPDFKITSCHAHAVAKCRFWKSTITEYDDACRKRNIRKLPRGEK
jgi:hypothetical protein